jgi:hypothetical protein
VASTSSGTSWLTKQQTGALAAIPYGSRAPIPGDDGTRAKGPKVTEGPPSLIRLWHAGIREPDNLAKNCTRATTCRKTLSGDKSTIRSLMTS